MNIEKLIKKASDTEILYLSPHLKTPHDAFFNVIRNNYEIAYGFAYKGGDSC